MRYPLLHGARGAVVGVVLAGSRRRGDDVDELAFNSCLNTHEGEIAFRRYPQAPRERAILAAEGSPLYRCLEERSRNNDNFCAGKFSRRPADAVLNVPAYDPWVPTIEPSLRRLNERDWLANEAGSIIAYSCPTPSTDVPVTLTIRETRWPIAECAPMRRKTWTALSLGNDGRVERVILPSHSFDLAPCVLTNACDLRFGDVGGIVHYSLLRDRI